VSSRFPATSRYFPIATTTLVRSDGTTVAYLKRRFVPPPERFALLQQHLVVQGERLDAITAHYFDDPEQFWRLCDGNGAMHPEELTEENGVRIKITLPEGVQGPG
jgi:hypothetical protein